MLLLLSTGKKGYVPRDDFRRRTKVNMHDLKTGNTRVVKPERYAYDVLDTKGYEEKFKPFLSHLPEGEHSYLEVGCGYGRWLPIISKVDPMFRDYVGIDQCYDRVKHAMQLHADNERARFSWIDAASGLSYLGCTFDVVFICNVMQHLRLAEKGRLVEFAVKHVRDGGTLIMFEGMVLKTGLGGCEEHYKQDSCPAHMIPTPEHHLKLWAKPLEMHAIGNEHFVARRTWDERA